MCTLHEDVSVSYDNMIHIGHLRNILRILTSCLFGLTVIETARQYERPRSCDVVFCTRLVQHLGINMTQYP